MEIWEKAALLRVLTGRSVLSLSNDLGMGQSAVGEWMKGHPFRLSAERVIVVLDALGLDQSGYLLPDVVHRWEIRDAGALPALGEVLWDEGGGWEMLPLKIDRAVAALPLVPLVVLRRAGPLRVMIRYRPNANGLREPALPVPDRLPAGAASYALGVDQANPRRLNTGIARRWWSSGDISVQAFDGLFDADAPAPTWADVQRVADLAGMGPSDILRLVDTAMA